MVPTTQGSVIICDRSKISLIPKGLGMVSAAGLVGRLLFVSSVVANAIKSCRKRSRILLHAGNCPPAAIATYTFLRATSHDVMLTVANPLTSPISTDTPSETQLSSSKRDIWSFKARTWAPNGIDLAFNFDVDSSVAKETTRLLSKRGTLVHVGGDLPARLLRGHHYISVDYGVLSDEGGLLDDALNSFAPNILTKLTPVAEVYEIHALSSAQARVKNISKLDIAVILDLEDINSELPVFRGGVIRGTCAFNPRATYVLIGGIGGLGVNIAQCLIENGARHLVLTSRSGDKVGYSSVSAGVLLTKYKWSPHAVFRAR